MTQELELAIHKAKSEIFDILANQEHLQQLKTQKLEALRELVAEANAALNPSAVPIVAEKPVSV